MKVSEFSMNTKVDHVIPVWAKDMKEDDFISYMPSYKGMQILDKFDEYKLRETDVGDITYYLYDPIKNGTAEPDRDYPLLVFIHGATNSFDGKVCVSHSGGEMFATEEYQKKMGGAYILVPIANEKKDQDGNLCDSWREEYMPHLKSIIELEREKNHISGVVIGGGSSGGYVSFRMLVRYPELFRAGMPVSSGYIPEINELKMLEDKGVILLYACGKHDEFECYNTEYLDRYGFIAKMKKSILYTPEWVRNGDGGVASLYFGIEMGQHCMITQLQANLMYDDGLPMCEEMPEGVTGWIRDIFSK